MDLALVHPALLHPPHQWPRHLTVRELVPPGNGASVSFLLRRLYVNDQVARRLARNGTILLLAVPCVGLTLLGLHVNPIAHVGSIPGLVMAVRWLAESRARRKATKYWRERAAELSNPLEILSP